MATEVEVWVSDKDSWFAHRSLYPHSPRHTSCGISLGRFDSTGPDLLNAATGKPKCTSCLDGIRVTQG